MTGKALVLGGSGLVGQALVKALADSGCSVVAPSRQELDFTATDASDRLADLVDQEKPGIIFNCVAYTQVDAAEDDEDVATLLNRGVPSMLARLAKEKPVRLVHFSTDFVFNGKSHIPYKPEDPTDPLSVYGKTKRAGEEVLLAADLADLLIVRSAWIFGPGRKNFVSTILGLCPEKRMLTVVHDQIGSPTYAPDLVLYVIKLVESGARGIFHVVNSGKASWCELASEAVRFAQLECTVLPIASAQYPQKAVRPAFSVLDCEGLERMTGIMPRPWPQALRDYIMNVFPPE